ncbi:MAG: acyl carrier protein [Thermodesulfobacteriota bacterium]|nr:acyl carrier protein [Thermodesulfobacteriota bacterium]
MEKQELTDKLLAFLRRALANKDAQVDPEAPLVDQGLNSSGRLELFTMIEDEWDLMLDEDDTDEVETFNDVVALVEKMLA